MRPGKKILRAYDRRQTEYTTMIQRREGDQKARDRMSAGGYKRPGSRNPKRVRG